MAHQFITGYITDLFHVDNLDLAVIFVILVLSLVYFKEITSFCFMKIEDNDSTTCSDKQCVRCNKYKDILTTAIQKLSNAPDSEHVTEIKDCIVKTKQRIHNLEQKPNVFFFERLFSVPVWDKNIFPDTKLLEEGYAHINEEFTKLPDKDSGLWIINNTPLGCWYIFPLINQGTLVDENASTCPKTMNIINSLPGIMGQNVFSNVMFSVIQPETMIAEHYGPTNIRLRCHLGLQASPACTLTVSDLTLNWETGQCLVFDDSFLHSVEHAGPTDDETDSSELLARCTRRSDTRAVLIVDLWHPDISPKERNLIDNIFCPRNVSRES